MFIPRLLIDSDDFAAHLLHRSGIVPSSMSPVFVVIALVVEELVLQVIHSPKDSVIQEFISYATAELFDKWMKMGLCGTDGMSTTVDLNFHLGIVF